MWYSQTTYYILAAVITVLVFCIGATVFSYLNLVIARLPKKEKLIEKKSVCPLCGHAKRYRDMIPIVSYAVRKGKCPFCFQKTSVREPLVELLGGVVAVLLLPAYGISWQTFTMFLLYSVLAVITFIDADTQEIPPQLNVLLFVIGLLSLLTMPSIPLVSRLIGMVCISLPMYIIVLVCNGFGGGDVKMMFAIGFFLGYKGTIAAFFIGVVLGGIYGIYLLLVKKKKGDTAFAFGPFLSVGIAISAYSGWGAQLLEWYLGLLTRNAQM
jgi:leader peptidase (prepilin peptidase)/N-methyltransferase